MVISGMQYVIHGVFPRCLVSIDLLVPKKKITTVVKNGPLKYFYYTYLFDVCTRVYKCGHRGQMASCRNQFSYSTVWVLGIKFRSSDLAGSSLTC